MMDKETQEGMKNLDVTVSAADLAKNASTKQNAEFSEQDQEIEITDKRGQ
jgi:hypothetical protein